MCLDKPPRAFGRRRANGSHRNAAGRLLNSGERASFVENHHASKNRSRVANLCPVAGVAAVIDHPTTNVSVVGGISLPLEATLWVGSER